jgi:hypothetical protein
VTLTKEADKGQVFKGMLPKLSRVNISVSFLFCPKGVVQLVAGARSSSLKLSKHSRKWLKARFHGEIAAPPGRWEAP